MNAIHNESTMSDPKYTIIYSKMTIAIVNFSKIKDIK